jgi:hypothetical protein
MYLVVSFSPPSSPSWSDRFLTPHVESHIQLAYDRFAWDEPT